MAYGVEDEGYWTIDSVRSAIDAISEKLSKEGLTLWDVEVIRHPFDGRSAFRLTVPFTPDHLPPKQKG